MSVLNFITLYISQQYFLLWGGLYLIRLYQVHLDTVWEWNLTIDKILTPLSTSLVILYENDILKYKIYKYIILKQNECEK